MVTNGIGDGTEIIRDDQAVHRLNISNAAKIHALHERLFIVMTRYRTPDGLWRRRGRSSHCAHPWLLRRSHPGNIIYELSSPLVGYGCALTSASDATFHERRLLVMESVSRAARYVTDGTVDVGHEFGLELS